MAAPKSEDYIPKDLASQIAEAIAKGISIGSKQGFSGANFMQDMTNQMTDFVKGQKAREVNEKVYAQSLAKGVSTRQAEIQVLAEMAKQENAHAIRSLQGKLKNKNLSFDERRELQGQLDVLREMPGLLESMTTERIKQLEVEEKQAKLQEDQTMVKEKFEEINDKLKARVGITDELLDQLRTPEMAKALFADAIIEKLDKAVESFEGFREMGLSAGDAVNAQFKGMSFASMLGLSDTKGVLQGVVEEFGNVNALSSETVNDLGKMAHHLGISGQEAMKLNASLSQMGGETSESAAAAMEHTAHLAEAQGIAGSKVFGDMAKNTGAMALYSKGGAEGFGKAAIELHKMGVEIGTAAKMADGLLDFESSINKQMEASVLLGREINLDKARELALSGDLEGSTAEVLKNIGGSAEFDKMNVMQKKALAEATGMSVEELQKSIDAQEESNKYFGEGASMADQALGTIMEYGSAAAGFMKENAELILSGTQFLLDGNLAKAKGFAMEAAHWVKQKAHMLWVKAQSMLGMGGGAAGAVDKVKSPEIKTEGIDKASKIKSGGGFKSAMKDLAGGFREMGGADVVKGIINTALAGPALIVALPSIPFLLFMGLTPLKLLKSNFTGLAQGLAKMGTGEAAMGSLNLMLFGVAGVVGVAAIPFMAFIAFAGTFVGAGLKALASGMSALAKPQVALGALILMGLALSLGASIMMMGIGIGIAAAGLSLMFKELANMPVASMMLLPIALQLMGIGLLTLGVAALIAAPGLFFATLALAGFAGVLALMQPIMEMGGLTAIADGLVSIAASAGGLTEVGLAVMGIGAGLGMMALAGLMALPIIGALIGLAAVAPALGALGSMFGGGGGDEKEDDKMQVIADKLDQLIAVASKSGDINMDGRKVGEIVRLGLNTSNVR